VKTSHGREYNIKILFSEAMCEDVVRICWLRLGTRASCFGLGNEFSDFINGK
jgi:hypothetical protein